MLPSAPTSTSDGPMTSPASRQRAREPAHYLARGAILDGGDAAGRAKADVAELRMREAWLGAAGARLSDIDRPVAADGHTTWRIQAARDLGDLCLGCR